jgi:hypothetical protein
MQLRECAKIQTSEELKEWMPGPLDDKSSHEHCAQRDCEGKSGWRWFASQLTTPTYHVGLRVITAGGGPTAARLKHRFVTHLLNLLRVQRATSDLVPH